MAPAEAGWAPVARQSTGKAPAAVGLRLAGVAWVAPGVEETEDGHPAGWHPGRSSPGCRGQARRSVAAPVVETIA